mmetsp:Transcript_102226/g.288803  ORF Transcript_102226/g.288803 Transcript_102226/m.288803 type:complete len:473 (-) Transcript_102226:62-1480(-)
MPAYRPGQGLSAEALQRLRARKTEASGIADLPAEDASEQWDQVLGEGAKKKVRCGICTRPLGATEQAEKRLVCLACSTAGGTAALESLGAALSGQELGMAIFYRLDLSLVASGGMSARSVGAPSAGAPPSSAAGRGSGKEASPRPAPRASSPEPMADVAQLPRGVALSTCGTPMAREATISVLSFNVLADCYVRVRGQPWNAFAHCQDADLDWDARLPRIVQMLIASEADVICLQEVVCERRTPASGGAQEWGLPAWTDQLERYCGVLQGLKQKEWDKNAERNLRLVGRKTPTGVATFYRSSRFEECAPSKHGSGSGTTLFLRARDQPVGDDRAGAAFEVAVSNVHLVGDPSKSDEHLKALNSVSKALGRRGHRVVCGDFNGECAPGSEVARWADDMGLLDAPTGTSWAEPSAALRLDHVYFSSGLRPIAVSGPLSTEEVASGLPCASCPSDHAPVAVRFAGGSGQKLLRPW